jgi:hypothetical protein
MESHSAPERRCHTVHEPGDVIDPASEGYRRLVAHNGDAGRSGISDEVLIGAALLALKLQPTPRSVGDRLSCSAPVRAVDGEAEEGPVLQKTADQQIDCLAWRFGAARGSPSRMGG